MLVAKRPLKHNTKHKKHRNTQQPTSAATALPSSGFAIFCHGIICHGLKSRHNGLLWVRCRRPAVGSRSWLLVPLFGALTHTPSKNRAMDVALTLGGCRFMIQHHNQPNSWCSGRGDARVEARGGGGERVGGPRPIVWTIKLINNKMPKKNAR
jgi:hypothetical protein